MKAPNETPSRGLTQSQTVRLECLRLVFHPTKDAPYLIAKALEFERYVTDGIVETAGTVAAATKAPDGQVDPTDPV